MLRHFSIIRRTGEAIFVYEPKIVPDLLIEPHLISRFLESAKFSEGLGAYSELSFYNLILYTKSFENFVLRLLVDKKLKGEELDEYFGELAKITREFLPEAGKEPIHSEKEFRTQIESILLPLISSSKLTRSRKTLEGKKPVVSKIAIVGLANAGKTSIKRVFFENWTESMVYSSITPTIGIETTNKFENFLKENLVIMDFGGQVIYRDNYLSIKYPWIGVTSLIYIVDMQEPHYFEESRNYLEKVWTIIKEVNDNEPKLAIFLHKYDKEKRDELDKKIPHFLMMFKGFINKASFFPTTIEDNSSNTALVKTLYFSLPKVMIQHLFEEGFSFTDLDSAIKQSLMEVQEIADDKNKLDNYRQELFRRAVLQGMEYGYISQEKWLKSIVGEWISEERPLKPKKLEIEHQGQGIILKVPISSDSEKIRDLTKIITEGVLTGILNTFHLNEPYIIEEKEDCITWKFHLGY